MAVLRIEGFSGRVPSLGNRALPDGAAQDAMNTWLYGNELRGMHPPTDVIAITEGTKKILRIPKRAAVGDPPLVPPTSDIFPVENSVWMQFQDPNTDIIRGQLFEDKFERWYFCSPSTGPLFNTYQRMVNGQPPYKLGVPGPISDAAHAPIIGAITGGAAPVTSRAYVYTWENEYGEESVPSWPDLGSGNANAVWNISNITDPVQIAGYPQYTKKNLYRTVTGESGVTTYYWVVELALGTTTYADDTGIMTDAIIVGNLMLESTSWQPPPDTLQGWIAMPNGFLIAFDKMDPVTRGGGNNIYMSEAYHWHAWPREYGQATEATIVGLGVLGTTCVVCTESYPTTVTGSTPVTCSFDKVTAGEPCMSRGSIVSTPQGVIYASQNGLISIGPSGIENVTRQLITKEDWRLQFTPQFIKAVRYQEGYLALRDIPGQNNRAFFIDPTSLKVALTAFTDMAEVVNFNVDFWSGDIFILQTDMVQLWDPDNSTALMPVRWLSKEFQYPFKENFGCYSIYWDATRYSNADYGLGVMPVDQQVRFRAYADRKIVYDQVVPRNGQGVRLPSGFKSDVWQFEIRARAPVYSLHVASSMKELKGV